MKGYRTVIFNILAAILPILETAGADIGLQGNALAIYGAAVAVGNIILRTFTTTPIGKK